jgi:hypothetical protein
VLGRPLTAAEAREVTGMIRRLAAIVLMQPELDANYLAIRDDAYEWVRPAEAGVAIRAGMRPLVRA